MDMEDEMEKFEITDFDLENEFNINRSKRGLSKHQQIYGIWADDSKDEDEKKKSFRSDKAPKNYSAPIGFVAGGVQQAGKKIKKSKPDKSLKAEKDVSDEEKPGTSFELRDSSDSEEEAAPRLGFGTSQNKKVPQQSTMTETTSDIAGFRTKNRVDPALINQGMGNWEKHTKGIGAKLLLQMGYEPGKGLGKELQGISTPVEAHLRKGRGAIGAYGPEKAASLAKPKLEEIKVKNEDHKELKGPSKWKRTDMSSKKTRYYYRSVDDVIEQGKQPGSFRNLGLTSELMKVKVIDMTGPQQRVLSGYHALSGLKAPPGVEHFEDVVHKKCKNFALPEIQHNLDLLVDMCEQDIIRTDRDTRLVQDRMVALKQEETSVKQTIVNEEKTVDNLKYIVTVVDKLMDPSQDYSLGQVGEIFRGLLKDYPEEYLRYELGELAPGLVGPLLTSALANWNPLQQPTHYVDFYSQWKAILEDPKQRTGTIEGNKVGIQPYDSLIWHTWVPVMRTCIRSWSPRDCDPMISLIEAWKPILPLWIMNNTFDQMIMPRILEEVKSWNPLTDTIPIHLWIHPWIPLLDERLQERVYPVIQDTLGSALSGWHPSDRSARLMLEPWQRALPPGTFLAFLVKHIVPKLQHCMQSMVINPHQQLLDPWQWVMDWKDMLLIPNMTLILEKCFFPRWLQTLAMWLNHNPNYNQVTEWYSGWKRMISDDLLAQPTIKDSFHKALEMMSRAACMIQQPGAKESISYLSNNEANSTLPPPPPKIENFAEAVRTAAAIPQGFKDLVTKRCEERGILFVPIPNKYHEAKQVYRIGTNGVQCYIDRNVIFYSQNGSTWIPSSLNRLLDVAS